MSMKHLTYNRAPTRWALAALVLMAGCGGGGGDNGTANTAVANGAWVTDLWQGVATPTILWVGAHPDDETMIAPLLGELCIDRGVRCVLIVMTRGEGGTCRRSEGCTPDMATVRTAEMQQAARLFNAELVQWDYENGPYATRTAVLTRWAGQSGGVEAMVDRMRREITRIAPSAVFTFDPRHGTSCHPDHLAAASVTLQAARDLGFSRDATYMVASTHGVGPSQAAPQWAMYIPAAPQDPGLLTYDASILLPVSGVSAWSYLIADIKTHRSQFTAETVAYFVAAPSSEQRIAYVRERDMAAGDQYYAGLCAQQR